MKFLRRDWMRYSKLGRKRKKKQKWRRPKGRDNKMREKRRGYPKVVSIGYRKEKEMRGKINQKNPVLVYNFKDIEKVKKGDIIILGKMGKKKKIEILKKAQEKNIPVYNINKKLLEEIKKKNES